MLNDIYQTPTTIEIENKLYSFEFNHCAYASFEKATNKSIFEMYENIIDNKRTKLTEISALLSSAMLKHHSKEEILELKTKIENEPWVWQTIEIAVNNAFITPLIPPKVLMEMSTTNKKKRKNATKSKTMNG